MGLIPIATLGHGEQDTPSTSETPGSDLQTMLSFFTITLLTGLASAQSPVTEAAAKAISRYPQGSVPLNETTLEAIGTLGAQGNEDDLSLLTDMAAHEVGAIQTAVNLAIEDLTTRLRLKHRAEYRGPSVRQVDAWLEGTVLLDDDGRALGNHESKVVAYTSLALQHGISAHRSDWRPFAQQMEADGQTGAAIQQYAAAVLMGEFSALPELEGFGLSGETLVLGLFVSLPSEAQPSSELFSWLKENGSKQTVAVFSDRAVAGSALQRAIALDTLSEMIQTGTLNRESTEIARRRIERSTNDPHREIRLLARTTLVEMDR